jgi:hypothetical protein
MKKKSIIKRLVEHCRNLQSEDKLRCKSLIGLIISELSLLFLVNLLVNFDLIPAIQKLTQGNSFFEMFCHFPDLMFKEKTVIVISLILVSLLFASIFALCHQLRTARKKHGFTFNTLIATKLLASVIQPRLINITYLSIFVLHVACLGNAIYSLLSGNSISIILLNILIIICILSGCIC